MPPAAAPRVRISCAAIVANVRALADEGALVDLRRDARGHGFAAVAPAILAATDADVLADARDIAASSLRSSRVRTAGTPSVDGAAAVGVSGAGTPAMTLLGTVLGVKPLRAGEGVSYGYTHRAVTDTRIALVTGGYAQGIPRILGNRAHVVIGGAPYPIVGRVAMDVCVVDVADAQVPRGSEVTFFGDPDAGAPNVSTWARDSGLRAIEIVTGVGLHVRREYDG